MGHVTKWIGLDVHKSTIAVGIMDGIGDPPRFFGTIANTPEAVKKMVRSIVKISQRLSFCYEAGPCGYGLYRQLRGLGHDCQVVAPALIPRKPGDRVKTDRRDALRLAQLHAKQELTSVWVPSETDEAIRDLTRAREDMKIFQRQARQRLGHFLLRHGKTYTTGKNWTKSHRLWLNGQAFDHRSQTTTFQVYLDTVDQANERVQELEHQMEQVLDDWRMAPVVRGLMAMRGIGLITAMGVIAEIGDLTRFKTASQLMAYLGLVPSEHSSGQRQHRGPITKTGNRYARRLLVESAWSYRFLAAKTKAIQDRGSHTTPGVRAIAWKAQKRLCARYRHLIQRGKLTVQACTAVARELAGFIWAIAWEIMPPAQAGGQT